MGNIVTNINSIMAFKHNDDVAIPAPKTLTEKQVALIRKSWEIPCAKVKIFNLTLKALRTFFYFHSQSTPESASSTIILSVILTTS